MSMFLPKMMMPKWTEAIYRRLGIKPSSSIVFPDSIGTTAPSGSTSRYKEPLWDPGASVKATPAPATSEPTLPTPLPGPTVPPSTPPPPREQPTPVEATVSPTIPTPTSEPTLPTPLPGPTVPPSTPPPPREEPTVYNKEATWTQPYRPPRITPPQLPSPAPPPPQTIQTPVPVEGVETPTTPTPVTPTREVPRGPSGFEREVPLPVGFSLPTPERLAELWQEVTGRPTSEEERQYFQSPQFLRVLTGRIPMWQAADPIWRRFFQLLGVIRNRVEEQ